MEQQRFGRLVVQSLHSINAHHTKRWLCVCDCGTETVVVADKLRSGKTVSCGCYGREISDSLKQLAAQERRDFTKNSWKAMKARCTNPKAPSYEKYGGRGITVCDRWLIGDGEKTGWICFYEDMGPRPEGTSIDRKDGTKGYFPGNCRWATQEEQLANRTNVGRPKKTRAVAGSQSVAAQSSSPSM